MHAQHTRPRRPSLAHHDENAMQGGCTAPQGAAILLRPLRPGQCIINTNATFAAPSHPLWLDNFYIKALVSSTESNAGGEPAFSVVAADPDTRGADVWLTRSVVQGGLFAGAAAIAGSEISVTAVSTASRLFAQGVPPAETIPRSRLTYTVRATGRGVSAPEGAHVTRCGLGDGALGIDMSCIADQGGSEATPGRPCTRAVLGRLAAIVGPPPRNQT